MRLMSALALFACNTAPLDYRTGKAPGARAPWAGPTETYCASIGETDTQIDGFAFCGARQGLLKIPVDDPIFQPCRDVASAELPVLSVFDGLRARAYAVPKLIDRELVNDQWGDEPLLIDF